MLFRKICGIDLGNDTIKITDKKKKKIICEKNMIAIRNKTEVLAVGNRAYEIYEKAPSCVEAGSPMRDGSIADGGNLGMILSGLLGKYSHIASRNPNILITAPMDLSEIEMRAFYKILAGLKVKKIALVEKGIADAVGIGLPVLSQAGSMVVNIGGATTEISVISDGKIILGRQLRLGGHSLDEAVATMVRRQHSLNIGMKTAEMLRVELGYLQNGPQQMLRIYGIHTISGLPKCAAIPSCDVSKVLEDTVRTIGENISATLQRTPPQLLETIRKNGIYLSGGVSLTPNIAYVLQDIVSVPVYNIPDPVQNTVNGLAEIMNDKELRKLTFSLRDYVGNLI